MRKRTIAQSSRRQISAWQAIVVALTLSSTILALHVRHLTVLDRLAHAEANAKARELACSFELYIGSRLVGLDALKEAMERDGGAYQDIFESTVAPLLAESVGFQKLAWIDASGLVKFSWPPKAGDQSGIGSNLLEREELASALLGSQRRRSMRMVRDPKAAMGELDFIAFVPVHAAQKFAGWMGAHLRFDTFLHEWRHEHSWHDYDVNLREAAGAKSTADRRHVVGDHPLWGTALVSIGNQSLELTLRMKQRAFFEREDFHSWLLVVTSLAAILAGGHLFWRRRLREGAAEGKSRREGGHDGLLLNILSHDLANQSLNVRATMAMIKSRVAPDVRASLERLESSMLAQDRLLTRIRDVRYLESGRKKLLLAPSEIYSAFEELAHLCEKELRAKGLAFDYRATRIAPQVMIDRAHFVKDVLANVLTNAIQSSPEGKAIVARAHGDHARVVIEIEDFGPGMDASAANALFGDGTPFAAAGSDGPRERGVGIGFLQIKAYMQAFGGKVAVESREKARHADHGTTIRLIFPVGDAMAD